MCWMAAIPMAISAVGGIADAVNDYQSAKTKNRTMEYNALVAENNVKIKEMEAGYARGQAQRNAAQERKQTAAVIGAQRAKMGASGVLVDSGSFLDVTASTREEGEKKAMGILQQGDMDAWHIGLEAANYREEAQQSRGGKVNADAILARGLLATAEKTTKSAFGSSK